MRLKRYGLLRDIFFFFKNVSYQNICFRAVKMFVCQYVNKLIVKKAYTRVELRIDSTLEKKHVIT